MALAPKTSDYIAEVMSAAHDSPGNVPATRYLILSTPRTGSKLLCRTLRNTDHAGYPAEYLNPLYIDAYRERESAPKRIILQEYIQFLEQRRTSANGLFGLNCHFDQISGHLKRRERQVSLLQKFDKIIVMNRRSKLYQSISFLKALDSDIWLVADDQMPEYEPEVLSFTPERISLQINTFIEHEAQIKSLMSEVDVPSLYIDYEEIDQDYPTVWRNVSEFLGLPKIELETVYPSMKRMRDATTDRLAEDYIRYLRGD